MQIDQGKKKHASSGQSLTEMDTIEQVSVYPVMMTETAKKIEEFRR